MQSYLSEMTARWLLVELARTTLLVAVLGVAAWLVLRLARVSSPALHRVCCVMVLLAGWTFVRWPVDVTWYEAPQPPVMAEVAAEPEPESFTPPIDPALLSPPPEFGAGMGAPVVVEPEAATVVEKFEAAEQPVPTAVIEPEPAWSFTWEQVAVAGWLGGVLAIVALWTIGYLRFLWQMPRGMEGEPEWQAEFAAAMAEQGRAARVEFRVTESAGPLLCRLPRRTVLLVPHVMWSALDAVERRAILRHELEHLSRGDLWKSLAVRVLALPHWFNPVAWLAVRRFDDAAEWACDRAAMNEQPTAYAAMLLRLGELAGTRARFGSAMSNRPLTTRIRRLLTLGGTEDSAMKKACLMSLLLLVVPLALVRVNLVAEEPAQEPPRDQAEHGQETPKPTSDVGIGYPPVFPTEEQMKATSTENLQPAEPPPAAEPDTPVKAAQRKMVEIAKKAFEANLDAYKAGQVTLDQVHPWSILWMTGEVALADSRDEQLAAARANLDRMKSIEASIRPLFERGAQGGQANLMFAASYYVADAERRLAEIEAMPEPQATVPQPAGNRALVDSAKQAFEATTAAYNAGTGTLETVISWSNRWLAAELEIARSREEQLSAANAHLERIGDLHTKVEALYRTGSNGGEANAMATVNYYLADAKRRLAEIEWMSTATNRNATTSASVGSFYSAVDLTGDTLKFLVMGNWYAWDDPAVVPALRTMLKQSDSSTVHAALMLTTARPSGQPIGARKELAPDLIQLLDHADPQIQNYTEQTLLDMRPEIEAVLQQAAKTKKPEIATRVKAILDPSRKVQQAAPGAFPAQPQPALPAPVLSSRTSIQPYTPFRQQAARLREGTHQPTTQADAMVVLGSKVFSLEDPALPEAIQSALRQGTTELKLGAMNLIRVRFEKNGITYERIHNGFAPELIALLGDEDPQVRDRAEAVLWSIGAAKSELQQAMKSDNPEIAKRAGRLLEGTGPVVAAAQAANRSVPLQEHAIPAKDEQKSTVTNLASPVTRPASPAAKTGTVDPYGSDRLHYDGKTFNQWRTQLQTDLSPTLRKEAINAIGEFATHGYGKEAAEVLFDTMRDYSVWTLGEDSPEGALKTAAVEAAMRIPAAERLPAVIQALSTGNKNQKLFALRIVPLDAAKAEIVPPLALAVGDADREIVELARAPLAIIDHGNAALFASIRRGLSSTDDKEVHNAVWLARGCPLPLPGQKAVVSEPFPELLPAALELLDHDDPKIQETTAAALTSSVIGPSQMHYVEALERIASSGEGAAAVHARKLIEQLNPQPIDRRR